MNTFINKVKFDYLHRTRNYSFLITLCISLAIAYTFVPEPNANYSTIRIGNYIGFYNSAWFGYVTAIMTSIFLFLSGFYLINSSIKTDIETKVGQIIAASPVSNITYLLSKVVSNFLILLTIIFLVLCMSIILFFIYNDGYPFEPFHFLKPYLFITLPSMLLVSIIAVVLEVLLGKYSSIQNVLFFFLFSVMLTSVFNSETNHFLDFFGNEFVTDQMQESVKWFTKNTESPGVNIGFTAGKPMNVEKFLFSGLSFPLAFILSRFLWILVAFVLLGVLSPFFHRFNLREVTSKAKTKTFESAESAESAANNGVTFSLPKAGVNYSIFPLIKTELALLYRKGSMWLNIFSGIGMILLAFVPLGTAHQMILPIVWFLQVNRLSELTTKEKAYNFEYLSYASYRPLSRLLSSQLISGIMFILIIASPLVLRLLLDNQPMLAVLVVLGAIFIVSLASCLGILTKGKKLFEVLFFMLAYANLNKIPFLDYFGGTPHEDLYAFKLLSLCLVMLLTSFLLRNRALKNA